MKARKPLIGIWDLDNTMGWKTPTYPAVTELNGDFLRYFSGLDEASSIFATGRPRIQAYNGLRHGGITQEESARIFAGAVFEDGLYVEFHGDAIHNALNEAPEEFIRLRNIMLGQEGVAFLKNRGYSFFPGCVMKQVPADKGIVYHVLDYDEKPVRALQDSELEGNVRVLYEQKNDVRATYKAPLGFMNNVTQAQTPFFKELNLAVKELLQQYNPEYERHAKLVLWEDAIEIYPVLRKDVFRKDIGAEMILSRIDPNKEATLVFGCDGKNDIELVNHLAVNHEDYYVIAPSNASPELKKKFEEHNASSGQKCFVLKQDCTEFGTGALALLKEKGVV
jgi:hydroxymethylpyrimidine pyrophosphatase-like HAD family hydrolase